LPWPRIPCAEVLMQGRFRAQGGRHCGEPGSRAATRRVNPSLRHSAEARAG
jgi:hypothetical protein